MPGIFISYRRDDSGGYAHRLYDLISAHFGKAQVFIDIDSIEAGADFDKVIGDRISQCDAFLAVIGPTWVRCTDEQGHRRLENPLDFVRREVLQALSRTMRVIPVLVGGARMPHSYELPADIQPLTLHNAHDIPDRFFTQSVQQLIVVLQASVKPLDEKFWTTRRVFAGSVVTLVGSAGILSSVLSKKTASTATQSSTASGQWPVLDVPSSTDHPRVILKEPEKTAAVPNAVTGRWRINHYGFPNDIVGPQQTPHLLWTCPVTIGDAWKIIGFAPDETVFVMDSEADTLLGIRNQKEAWAYRRQSSAGETLRSVIGITPDGCVWIDGDYPHKFCFNSKGEGGLLVGAHPIPHDLLSDPADARKPTLTCSGGTFQISSTHTPVPVDGNCEWVVRDDSGKIYVATDRGSVYCFSVEGKVLWKFDGVKLPTSDPIFSLGDLVLHSDHQLLSIRDGAVRWTLPASGTPYFADKIGTIYLSAGEEASLNSFTVAVDHDGKVLWRVQTGYGPVGLKPAGLDPDGHLYLTRDSRDLIVCIGV